MRVSALTFSLTPLPVPQSPQRRWYGEGVGGYTPTDAVGSDGSEVRPQFPGATAGWTHDLEFVNADRYNGIPVYRVMDRSGRVIQPKDEPQVGPSPREAGDGTWESRGLCGAIRFGCRGS